MLRSIARLVVPSGFALACLLLAPSGAGAAETQLLRSASYGGSAGGFEKSKEECKLATNVPEMIAAASSEVKLVDALPKSGRVLEVSITDVHAPGGGAFSGPKWLEVSGTLKDKGKVIGTFRAKRMSTGGAWATFKGTCTILHRCSKTIGQDVAGFLANPSMNAELGDAR